MKFLGFSPDGGCFAALSGTIFIRPRWGRQDVARCANHIRAEAVSGCSVGDRMARISQKGRRRPRDDRKTDILYFYIDKLEGMWDLWRAQKEARKRYGLMKMSFKFPAAARRVMAGRQVFSFEQASRKCGALPSCRFSVRGTMVDRGIGYRLGKAASGLRLRSGVGRRSPRPRVPFVAAPGVAEQGVPPCAALCRFAGRLPEAKEALRIEH
jgi:hypothetical protein